MRDLETLNAIEDIRRIEARYARYADQRRWRDLAGLFTDDGVFRPLDEEGHEQLRMTGRDEIASTLAVHTAGDLQPIHQLFTHEIDIESSTSASAIWAMADLIFRGESSPGRNTDQVRESFRTMRGWGHYRVTYRKVDGEWLISSRTLARTRLEYTY